MNHSHLQISPPIKNVLKLTLALPGDALGVLWCTYKLSL